VRPRVLDRLDLSLDAPVAEPAGDEIPSMSLKLLADTLLLDLLRVGEDGVSRGIILRSRRGPGPR